MKYRLSLDLGVGSIASAILPLDDNNKVCGIKDAGVCVFEVSEGASERREKRGARKNYKRRKLRLSLLAEALDEAGLWTFDEFKQERLIKLSPYAIRAQAANGKLNDIQELGRAILHIAKHRGAGFVDIQKVELENQEEQEDKKSKKNTISEYAQLDSHLKDAEAKTIGEYFYMRLHRSYKQNYIIKDSYKRYVRQRENAIPKYVDFAVPRYLVKNEFDFIWDKQSTYYPQLKDQELKDKIYNILFYEKYHRPYAVGRCIFIDSEYRLPKAHPVSEQRRIYEEVNNITIQELEIQRKLDITERDKIIDQLLMKGSRAGITEIKQVLGLGRQIKVKLANGTIKPYLYSKEEFTTDEIFSNLNDEQIAETVLFIAEPRLSNNEDYLYNDEEVIEILKKRLNCTDNEKIAKIVAMVPKERTKLGITATTAVVELLKRDVISIREATDFIAKSDERFVAEEERARQLQGSYDKLPYYGEILRTDTQPIPEWLAKVNKSLNDDEIEYGKLANPGVHRILNQLRKVVNDIIRIYGKPYEINIELAREVGMSAKKKNEYERKQKDNQRLNEEAAEYLRKHRLAVNNTNILKYKLAKEQCWKDAFNPENEIPQNFEGMEIEHLVPRSAGGTDAPINRVLIKRSDNLSKGKQYPYEFLQQNENLYKVLETIRKNENMPEAKKWRFESDAREVFESGDDEDNITRYLTDTRYVCKLAARYLKAIVDYKHSDANNTRVLTINGGHTAKLRRYWNLEGIEYDLMGLEREVPKYLVCDKYYYNIETGDKSTHYIEGEEWEERTKKRNPDWLSKPRIDHRHHAVDAIVVGCLSRSDMQKINWSDKRGYELPLKQLDIPLAQPDTPIQSQLSVFRQRVFDSLKDIKVYHKPERSKQRQMHEATPMAMIKREDEGQREDTLTRYSKNIMDVLTSKSALDKLLIGSSIKSEWHRQIEQDKQDMIKLREMILDKYDEASAILEEENRILESEDKKAKRISEKTILIKAFGLILGEKLPSGRKVKTKYPVYTNMNSVIPIERHNVAYKSGRNYMKLFYADSKDKTAWECINVFDANNPSFKTKCEIEGCKNIWSLCVGDMVELNTPEQWQKYTDKERCLATVKTISSNKIGFKLGIDARATTGDIEVYIQDSIEDKGLRYCTQHLLQKIELTPFGKVARKHKRLWHGKKEEAQ